MNIPMRLSVHLDHHQEALMDSPEHNERLQIGQTRYSNDLGYDIETIERADKTMSAMK
jgi:hypothetical protein